MNQLFKVVSIALFAAGSMVASDSCDISTCSSCIHEKSIDDCCPKSLRTCNASPACELRCGECPYPCGTTTFIPRSQGANTARELVGWQKHMYRPYLCENYAAVALATEYTHSFRASDLAQRLFCTDCLAFRGSQATRISGKDIIADYFGLPTDFKGTVSIKPSIENYIVDLEAYWGLDDWCKGLYSRLHIPITHTRWSLGLDECVVCDEKFRGHDDFPKGYMWSETPADPQFRPGHSCPRPPVNQCELHVFGAPFCGRENCTTQSIRVALSGNFIFGDMTEPWQYGRFDFCPRTKTGVADVDVIVGYNLWQSDFGHLSFFGQVVVPTGNTPQGKYIFEPIIGNGKHWELGGGFSTHISLYSDYDNEYSNSSLYIEGNVTHIFKNDQIRAFDFTKNGLLSRYMLLKEYNINHEYIGRTINAINFATRNCDVSIGYKFDFSAKAVFELYGWMVDLGYNTYGQQAEKVCIKTECPCAIDQRIFGIKGTEGVACVQHLITGGNVTTECCQILPDACLEKLNATQPNATMFDAIEPIKTTIAGGTCVCLDWQEIITTPVPIQGNTFAVARTHEQPVIISCADLDPNSAAQPSMFTHKIFTHIGYMWHCSCYEPHVGIGGEVEFNGKNNNSALSQWGVWFKGGITF